jgi:hypothetical protein
MADNDSKPKRTYAENLELAKARVGAAKKAIPKAPAAKQSMLPFWPDDARRVPNLVLRNALFGVSKDREFYGPMRLISSLDGHTVKVTERLNQHDLDNLEMLLHLQREQPLGSRVAFTAHGFLKAMGRGTSGKHHKELHEDLTRLARATVEIRWTNQRKSYTGSLVSGFARDEDTGTFVVTFNQDMMRLYEAGSTQIDWEQRQQLGKSLLAKWLQMFYTSHDAPFAMKVDTLREKSGSDSPLREFRRMLKVALDKLIDIGLLSSWVIEDDLVKVQKLKKVKARG